MSLQTIPGHSFYRVDRLRSVDSTNDVAFAHGDAGDLGNLWIVAERQTKGRGRRGRPWISEAGNLYASLLLPQSLKIPTLTLSQIPIVAALAVHDAVSAMLGPASQVELRIKWPNDILGNGAKIAGILAESRTRGRTSTIVIGIGVNCAHHPPEARYPATNLSALGHPVGAEDLIGVLVGAFDKRLVEWNCGRGFGSIRKAWLAGADIVGRHLSVSFPEGILAGKCVGLDDQGGLILNSGGVDRHITVGEVTFDLESR